MGTKCTALNEVFIEHANSIISRSVDKLRLTFEAFHQASIISIKKRVDKGVLKEPAEVGFEG
jgi:hypothetical protein